MSASLQGQEALLKDLLDRVNPEQRAEMLDHGTKLIKTEAVRLVPRETGELQGEITILNAGDPDNVKIGVPASSPANAKAWATEHGTWNYSVGSPSSPKTDWPAKSKPTAAMPWLRTAVLVAKPRILRFLRRRMLTGRRQTPIFE